MVSQDRIEHAVRSHPDPVVTVADVVDALDVEASDTHVRQQMRVLEGAGTLASKDVGARAVAWWHETRVTPPETDPAAHPDQAGLDDVDARRDEHTADVEDDRDDVEDLPRPSNRFAVGSVVDDLDTPPQSTDDEHMTAALAVVGLIETEGSVTRKTTQERLHDDVPAGYDDARTWWRKVARPVLQEHPDVKDAAGGNSPYRWIADE